VKKLNGRLLAYGIITVLTIIIMVFLFIRNSMTFDSILPNIIVGLFQTVILGLIFHSISLINRNQRIIMFNECIKVIIIEPFVRFKSPENNSIDLEKVNYFEILEYFLENISKSSLNNYKEFLNVFYMQKPSVIGLMNIASQIDPVHVWAITCLIATYTKALDELESLLKNNKFDCINDIDNIGVFKMRFHSLIELYARNCLSYMNIKKD
jgi:hypothetical protein